jgi:hypothetical protein
MELESVVGNLIVRAEALQSSQQDVADDTAKLRDCAGSEVHRCIALHEDWACGVE